MRGRITTLGNINARVLIPGRGYSDSKGVLRKYCCRGMVLRDVTQIHMSCMHRGMWSYPSKNRIHGVALRDVLAKTAKM